jgi:hypothetical protein
MKIAVKKFSKEAYMILLSGNGLSVYMYGKCYHDRCTTIICWAEIAFQFICLWYIKFKAVLIPITMEPHFRAENITQIGHCLTRENLMIANNPNSLLLDEPFSDK